MDDTTKPVPDLTEEAKKAAQRLVDAESDVGPWNAPGWYKGRKFIGSVLMTGVCLAVAAATNHLNVETAISCSAPMLAWAGLHLPSFLAPPVDPAPKQP